MLKTFASRCAAALFLLLTVSPASAEDVGSALITPLVCDVDGDGRKETVAIRPFLQNGVELGQMVLLGPDGATLWEGPDRTASIDYPLEPEIFLGEFDLGTLEAVGDLAGDGRLLLLGTYQKSDVSPTRFRLFEWNGKAFTHVRSGHLTPAPQRPGTFVWGDHPEASQWIERFTGESKDGAFTAVVADATAREPGQVTLRPVGGEFVISE